MEQKIYYLHTLSGLHVGTGQGTGVIDLPLARERASNLPLVPGSGIKGVLRDEMRSSDGTENQDCLALFGPEAGENASEYAGALRVGDAKLLAMPIRSWAGTFAWATCPMVLQRYQRDLKHAGIQGVPSTILTPPDDAAFYAEGADPTQPAKGTALIHSNDTIFLEDLDLKASAGGKAWADFIKAQLFAGDSQWQEQFTKRFLILSDSAFDFLAETATEIRARIRIQEGTRTVQDGALWYEEYLPAETLLWGLVACDRSRNPKNAMDAVTLLGKLRASAYLQVGGKATTGAGQARWIIGMGGAQ